MLAGVHLRSASRLSDHEGHADAACKSIGGSGCQLRVPEVRDSGAKLGCGLALDNHGQEGCP